MARALWRISATLSLAAVLVAPSAAWSAVNGGQIDHVESQRGQVDLLFSVPGLADSAVPDLGSVRVNLNGKSVKVRATSTAETSGRIQRTAVLAIDVSKSMAGAPFEQAKQAALTFLEESPGDVRVGIVAFASRVQVVNRPTTDRTALGASVEALELSPRTSLYDGVLEAVLAAGRSGLRSVVVLSDGRDTTRTPLTDVTRAVAASQLRVDVVALGQGGARSPLEQIAAAGHGAVIDASQPKALNEVFSDEAAALASQILISFPVPRNESGADASITVNVEAGGRRYSDSAVVALRAATTARPPGPIAAAPPGLVVSGGLMVGGIAAFCLGLFMLALLGLGVFRGSGENTIERRLAAYGRGTGEPVQAAPSTGDIGVRRAAIGVAEKALGDGKLSVNLARKVDAAGVPLTPAEWLLLHVGLAVGAAFVALVVGGGSLPFVLLFFALGTAVPWLYLGVKRARRLKRFQAQLAPTLQVMSGSLTAGLSMAQAVGTVVREGSEPIADEFRRALVEQRLGVEIEDALEGVADRMDSKDFSWMVMAVRIQREVGGNLAELLNTVAGTLREREYIRRQVSTLSAEGRLSAWIIGGLPPAFITYLALVRPEYLSPMLHSPVGWLLLGVASIMMTVGAAWLKQTVKIEV